MRKCLYLIFILLGCFNNNFLAKKVTYDSDFLEEVIPIRNEENIIGINYYITLTKSYNDDKITTHIIDSIYHYKELDNTNNFLVTIILKNNSKYNYRLKKVLLKNNDIIRRDFSYNIKVKSGKKKIFKIFLKDNLNKNDLVEIKLKK